MNYYEIGQRIRKFRKAYGFSQEQLADKISISTTHMSHIETGNTKLSLPVLVKIAEVLNVQTDELLFECPRSGKHLLKEEILSIMDSCSAEELYFLTDIIKFIKISIDKRKKI